MLLFLYAATALVLLWLMQRFVRPAGRNARIVLFFLPFVFTGIALIQDRVYAPLGFTYQDPPLSDLRAAYGVGDPHNPAATDIYTQMIPWRHVVRESFSRGEWPLWNPFILCGDILAGSAQSAPYSPFTLIACLLPAAISFTFTAAITFFLAAASAFAFARELDCRETVALFAGAAWMCSSAIFSYVLWPLGICWALLPFVLVATHRVVHQPSVASFALLTTGFTLVLLGGHPESALHVIAIGALYGAFLWLQTRRWTSAAIAVAAAAVALALCAIYLLPIVDAIPQTAEIAWRSAIFSDNAPGASSADVIVRLATDAFPFLHLRLVKSPAMQDLKGETAAAGSIVLAFAPYAFLRARSRATWFFGALAAFCLLAGAEWGPVSSLFRKLPLVDVALHERLAFGAAFCLVVLAALGLEHVLRENDRFAAATILAAVCVALALGTWWIRHAWTILDGPATWGRYTIAAELVGLAIAIALVARVKIVVPLLVVLLLAQRFTSEAGMWESYDSDAAYPPVPLFEPLKNVREPFRVVGAGFALIPGTSALYGLEDVRGYEAMTLRDWAETYRAWCTHQPVFFNRVDDLSKPFLSMMNVRFAIARRDVVVPDGWRVVAKQPASLLLENANVLPRAFVPRNVTLGLQNALALDEMTGVKDFRERAWISENTIPRSEPNGPGRVAIRRPAFGEYDLKADMDARGWVVVSESAWRGWRAYLDGRRVTPLRANVAFISVLVPKGHHDVRLVYRPRAFDVGLRVSATTLAALIAFAVLVVIRRRR